MTDRVVVIDTETTGLFSLDRVIEIAVVSMDLSGRIIDEWDTLVNPGRDVGPTWLHGITASMLADAPVFEDIAAELAARLHGAVLCAHNLNFDTRMLAGEYARTGAELDFGYGLDTLVVTGTKLSAACAFAGVPLSQAHCALADARAAAGLLLGLADRFETAAAARLATPLPSPLEARRLSRLPSETLTAPPTFIARLLTRVVHKMDSGTAAVYLDDLDRAMTNIDLDEARRRELSVLAADLGLSQTEIDLVHRRWVDDLIALAAADGVVDGEEYEQLLRAAHLLGVDAARVEQRTIAQRSEADNIELRPGMGVCFTGAVAGDDGYDIPREQLQAHAEALGLRPEETFTKSRCELLVAADAASQSGKARKARTWGIPIVSAADFLALRDLGPVAGIRVSVGGLHAFTCDRCGAVFTAARARSLCEQCRSQPSPMGVARAQSSPGSTSSRHVLTADTPDEQIETLVCRSCAGTFQRVRTRGRKPHHCPECAA